MQPLPGFRDFLPKDCAARNYIFESWREVARRYGFVEWDGPLLEPTELYTKKSGPEIVGQLFNFTDKGDREVAMRPELTPTLARVVAAHEREFKKPLKWFSIPQCFRYEKQQRGRLREHYQFNADIIGEASLEADVELIALCVDLLRGIRVHRGRRGGANQRPRILDRFSAHAKRAGGTVAGNACRRSTRASASRARKRRARLGSLAEPAFQILDGGGKSEKLDRLLSAPRSTAAWRSS